jgi:hypothetical protein
LLDRNIFLAECLIWHGPEHFLEKLDDQRFKYATWRDEQLVAIMFNRSWSRFDRASSRWASARTRRSRASNSSTVAPPVFPVAAVTKTVSWLMCDLLKAVPS